MQAGRRFRNYSWIVLVYNLAVILWGAYVRATHSGAGCGAHWPLCNGEVVPQSPRIETIIEFSHRLSSGLVLVLVIVMIVWAWRIFPRGHMVRRSTALVLFFTITEALVGAGLVLFELVAGNDSIARALAMVTHLINTFLLLASLSLTAWWSTHPAPERLHWHGRISGLLTLGLFALLVLGASGAVTALGDTLFPAGSLREGLEQDFSPTAHFLIRLRIFHPLIAGIVGLYVASVAYWLRQNIDLPYLRSLTLWVVLIYVVQLGLGAINILLLAPVWMQMIHLLVADLIWIGAVLMSGVVFGAPVLVHRLIDHQVNDRVDQLAGKVN